MVFRLGTEFPKKLDGTYVQYLTIGENVSIYRHWQIPVIDILAAQDKAVKIEDVVKH